MKRAATALAFALMTSGAAHAMDAGDASAAEEPEGYPEIHLDVSPAESAVVPLLRAELDELGLRVIDGPTSGRSITIHAHVARNSLEVRISDDRSGSTLLHEVFSVADGRSMDPRTAVLHASELLRWHLHYRTPIPARAASPKPLPPPPSPPPPAADEQSDFRLGLLPLATYSPGGTRLGLSAQLELSRSWGWFAARLLGAAPLVPNRMSVAEGQLQAKSGWLGLEGAATWQPFRPGPGFELGVGGALFASALSGDASGDDQGREDRLVTFAPLIELRARQRITRGFSLVLASQCLLPLEALRLRVLERQVGRYGREMITLGLGLELTLF